MALRNILRKRGYARQSGFYTVNKNDSYVSFFLSSYHRMFSRHSGRIRMKNRRIRATERSNSVNDSNNCAQQCCARDIIAYCVQFANGSRRAEWFLAPFYTFIPATVTPLLTQFVTTTDDGLPRLCSGGMIHRYRCVRHDLSRLTIVCPFNSFGFI